MKIEIDGKKYEVVEKLPYHGRGYMAKAVKTPDGEKVAVKDGGKWRFWMAWDRVGKTDIDRA